jgi:hypothetical protein
MKKIVILAALAAFVAAPADAASTSVEFTNDAGEKQVWKFRDDGVAEMPDGATAAYTWDEATRKLCATIAGETPQTLCATFDPTEGDGAVGETSGYTLDDGRKGTATIIAKEE